MRSCFPHLGSPIGFSKTLPLAQTFPAGDNTAVYVRQPLGARRVFLMAFSIQLRSPTMRIQFLLVLVFAVVGVGQLPAVEFYEYPDPEDSVEVIYPDDVGEAFWPESNLIQGPGIGFDEEEPHDKIGGGAAANWVTTADCGFPCDYIDGVGMPTILLDLGQDVVLDEISTWGYEDGNTNGAREFSLRFATDGDGENGFGTSVGYNPSFIVEEFDEFLAIERRSFEFDQAVVARYVELTVTDNYFDDPGDGTGDNGWGPGGDRVGMGEIAFRDSGLDPADFAGGDALRAGDADQDLDFDALDLVKVQIAGKYLSGAAATWGEGDWNGAPGGSVGNPPAGDNVFDALDIIAALNANIYLTGKYAAVASGGTEGDGQTSVVYNAGTGEVAVDAPAGVELTSINIDSAGSIFTGEPAQNLGGSFDNDSDNNIFKATFGGSFGSLSFGNVAQAGLPQATVLDDLTVVGSLAGGGDLGNVDLIYVPEPTSMILAVTGLFLVSGFRRRRAG